MQTNDRSLNELLKDIDMGKIQLPDFQRGWVWDDNRIKALIASITRDFPVGAAMFLEFGNESFRFKFRPLEGVSTQCSNPSELVLDGQQRLTSLYSSLYSIEPVNTVTDKGQKIKRYYYIDIEKANNPDIDRFDAIQSVPETKQLTANFGREIILDLSTPEKEYEQKLFPLNILFDPVKTNEWQQGYYKKFNLDPNIVQEYLIFYQNIILKTMQYKIPVIRLDKDTPKEAVCQVFENVNTGGVSLTVFELVTAVFAMDDFELRKDWLDRKEKYFSNDALLSIVTETDFLQACTLYTTYKNKKTVSCKRKDILNLTLEEYKQNSDALTNGFIRASKLLQEERIFSSKDLPYSTQFIPLSVICTLLIKDNQINQNVAREKIKQWYWCGVFGELYGSANETRYVNDVVEVLDWVKNGNKIPRTIAESYFNPTRLMSLQSRLSAAYKGVMALVYKNHCKDFISGEEMDFTLFRNEQIDIHHIFPKDYCVKKNYPKEKWNSVINKTPITASTNREIGGVAPTNYLSKLEKKKKVTQSQLNEHLSSHWVDIDSIRSDDFNNHIIFRAKAILKAIESATGKSISGMNSPEVIKLFGCSLSDEKDN